MPSSELLRPAEWEGVRLIPVSPQSPRLHRCLQSICGKWNLLVGFGKSPRKLTKLPPTSSANSSPTSLPCSLLHGPLLAGGSSLVTLPTDLCFYSPSPPLLSLEFKSLSPQSMRVKGTHTQVPRGLVKGEGVVGLNRMTFPIKCLLSDQHLSVITKEKARPLPILSLWFLGEGTRSA